MTGITARLMQWTIDNPRPYRVILLSLIIFSQMPNAYGLLTDEAGGWIQLARVGLLVFTVTILTFLVRSWMRQDGLELLKRQIEHVTDEPALGTIAWLVAYQWPLREIRDVNHWLATHDLSRHPRDDMPPQIGALLDRLVYPR